MNERDGIRLLEYLDRRLPPGERAEVEDWIARDPEARRLLAEHERLWALLGEALPSPDIAASPDFRERTLRLAEQERPAALLPFRARAVALLAASLLVAVVGWAWWSASRRSGLSESDRAVVGQLRVLEDWDFLQAHGRELDMAVKGEVLLHLAGELPKEAPR
jgi:anti-sigma factor RsiW